MALIDAFKADAYAAGHFAIVGNCCTSASAEWIRKAVGTEPGCAPPTLSATPQHE